MGEFLSSTAGSGRKFETTHWELVLAAGEPAGSDAVALREIYRIYSFPVYSFVRRRGYERPDAQDITQEFFLHLIEKNTLSRADRSQGKFRTFLLGALQFFLAHRAERARTQKRGGNASFVSLDDETAEVRYQVVDPRQTAEQVFDSRWASTLVGNALQALKIEMTSAGKEQLFNELQFFLLQDGANSYEQVAGRLGLSLGALKTSIHRFRTRYRSILRETVAQTVANPADIDEEIRALRASLEAVGVDPA